MLNILTGSPKDRKAVACIIPTPVRHTSYCSQEAIFQQIQTHLREQQLNVNNARKQSGKIKRLLVAVYALDQITRNALL